MKIEEFLITLNEIEKKIGAGFCLEVDNQGQIVIYTGLMYDKNGDVTEFIHASDKAFVRFEQAIKESRAKHGDLVIIDADDEQDCAHLEQVGNELCEDRSGAGYDNEQYHFEDFVAWKDDSYYQDHRWLPLHEVKPDWHVGIRMGSAWILDPEDQLLGPGAVEAPTDVLAAQLTAHFAKAAAAAVADLHSKGLPAHGDVDGVWTELAPPEGKKPGR